MTEVYSWLLLAAGLAAGFVGSIVALKILWRLVSAVWGAV